MIDPTVSAPLTDHLRRIVVEVIQAAYRENAPLQERAIGHGDWNYSLDIHATIKHFLRERLGDIVVEEGNSLRLDASGVPVFVHKVGRSELDNPWRSLPSNAGPAGAAAEMLLQEPLPFGDFDFQARGRSGLHAQVWVVCHYGNLDDGLRAVRLQASGDAEDSRIKSWVEVIDLYVASGTSETVTRRPGEPAPVEIEEPEVRLRPREAEGEASA